MLGAAILAVAFATALGSHAFIIGAPGASCADACLARGLNCNPHIPTNDSTAAFQLAGYNCTAHTSPSTAVWASGAMPFVSDAGMCEGYVNVSGGVACPNWEQNKRRLCNCEAPVTTAAPFSTGWSQAQTLPREQTVFAYVLPPGGTGVMDHLWLTPCLNSTMVRYYIDGEEHASIQFKPSLAAGVGHGATTAPWGTTWIGKAAKTGGWMWNFKVPFQRSVRVTIQTDLVSVLYIILRGAQNIPITIGGVTIPQHARLLQFVTNATIPPLEVVDLASVPAGTSGLLFMHVISGAAENPNSLEGCYHLFSPPTAPWPGTLLSTGTEDFFDSAYYFDGGEYRLPVDGLTEESFGRAVTFSAYRFHEEDPILFDDGMRFTWRNGDLTDASGNKCFVAPGQQGQVNGHPSPIALRAYAWVYVWTP